jgi:hypothetical protein
MVASTDDPSYVGDISRRLTIQAGPGRKCKEKKMRLSPFYTILST